jgi:hypothetical protein
MPEFAKDTAIAVMGASVGLAGLLLVVAGFVFSQVNSFPPEHTDDSVIKNYEIAGKLGLIPFLVALADAAVCLVWLLHSSQCVFSTAIWGFFLLLALTALYGSVLILRYL